jgi:hypothetical protein
MVAEVLFWVIISFPAYISFILDVASLKKGKNRTRSILAVENSINIRD